MKAGAVLLASLAMTGCTIQPLLRSSAGRAPSRLSSLPSSFAPPAGRAGHIWHVPAGRGMAEVVVGWSYRSSLCRLSKIAVTGRCHGLTVWRRSRPGRWTATTLFRRSPFPFTATSVRTADVTGDGHRDLLVTVECNACNHAAATAAVYADVGGHVRRIYGDGFNYWSSKATRVGVPGRTIFETAWGASRGLVWFDVPHYGPRSSLCCPDYRIQTFLRWDGAHWRTVKARKVAPGHGYLDNPPVPAP